MQQTQNKQAAQALAIGTFTDQYCFNSLDNHLSMLQGEDSDSLDTNRVKLVHHKLKNHDILRYTKQVIDLICVNGLARLYSHQLAA